MVHKDFKTANVLVDENFIAKVADAGLRNFLGRIDIAGPSSQVTADEIFLSPEYYALTLSSLCDCFGDASFITLTSMPWLMQGEGV